MGTDDYPTMETGGEETVALPGHVYVSTQSDSDGAVRVQVRRGEVDLREVRTVYEGRLQSSSGVLSITAPGAEDERTIVLPRPGDWHVEIAVGGHPRPDSVAIFFDEEQWQDKGNAEPAGGLTLS